MSHRVNVVATLQANVFSHNVQKALIFPFLFIFLKTSHAFNRSRRKLWAKAHHCWPVRVRQNDREREFVSQVLVHARTLFVFKKKMNLDRTAVQLHDFLSCAGPRSSHQRQRFSTSHVAFYTSPPAAADSPAAPGWAGQVLLRSIPTCTCRNFDFFFECLTKVHSSFSPFEFAHANEGIEPSNIRLSPSF